VARQLHLAFQQSKRFLVSLTTTGDIRKEGAWSYRGRRRRRLQRTFRFNAPSELLGFELAYLSKGYVDSVDLDEHYAKVAAERKADWVIFDIGRWSKSPGTGPSFSRLALASIDRLLAGLRPHGGRLLVVWGGVREDVSSVPLSQLDATLKRELLRRHPPSWYLIGCALLAILGRRSLFSVFAGTGSVDP